MNTLYDYAEKYRSALEKLLDTTDENGEVDADVLQELENAKDALEVKTTNCGMMFLELQAEVEKIKAFEKKVAERRQSLERRADSLKRYIDANLRGAGVEKVKSDLVTIGYRASERVEIDNVEEIPEEYFRVKVEVDKAAVKQALKAGATMGAHLEQTKTIQIK